MDLAYLIHYRSAFEILIYNHITLANADTNFKTLEIQLGILPHGTDFYRWSLTSFITGSLIGKIQTIKYINREIRYQWTSYSTIQCININLFMKVTDDFQDYFTKLFTHTNLDRFPKVKQTNYSLNLSFSQCFCKITCRPEVLKFFQPQATFPWVYAFITFVVAMQHGWIQGL